MQYYSHDSMQVPHFCLSGFRFPPRDTLAYIHPSMTMPAYIALQIA